MRETVRERRRVCERERERGERVKKEIEEKESKRERERERGREEKEPYREREKNFASQSEKGREISKESERSKGNKVLIAAKSFHQLASLSNT
jgi:hypothetical protein